MRISDWSSDVCSSDLFWNKTGGHINPLALARGLAHAVVDKGGVLYSHTPAIRFEREGGHWVVRTPFGQVHARALILAPNAYPDPFPSPIAPSDANQVEPSVPWQMANPPFPPGPR